MPLSAPLPALVARQQRGKLDVAQVAPAPRLQVPDLDRADADPHQALHPVAEMRGHEPDLPVGVNVNIARVGSRTARAAVTHALDHPDSRVRANAIEALEQAARPAAAERTA